MPNLDLSGRQILGCSSRENGTSSLLKKNDVFLVKAAKPNSYCRSLVPASLWPSMHPSFSTALPALVWGLVMPGQMCPMLWEAVSCKGCHRESLATTFGKFHGLPRAPWSFTQDRPEVMRVTASSFIGGLRIFIPVFICFSMVVRSLSSYEGVERAFGNWKSSSLRITEGLRHPKTLVDYTDW